MRNDTITRRGFLGLTAAAGASSLLSGCGGTASDGKRHVEVVTYKQEAVKIFERLQDEFNATHDDIAVSITCPNNATTVMRTRFIREDYPDIIGIGGDISFSNFIDAGILADVSDFEGLGHVKPAYLDILETLEFVPTEGTFGVPYMANAAGVLYNRQMFREHGWDIPTTWQEFIDLCETIRAAGILPLYFGFKDTWTTLAPWNALAIELAPLTSASRSTPAGPPSPSTTARRPRRSRRCSPMARTAPLPMATTTPARHSPVASRPCTPSAATQCRRSSRSTPRWTSTPS